MSALSAEWLLRLARAWAIRRERVLSRADGRNFQAMGIPAVRASRDANEEAPAAVVSQRAR